MYFLIQAVRIPEFALISAYCNPMNGKREAAMKNQVFCPATQTNVSCGRAVQISEVDGQNTHLVADKIAPLYVHHLCIQLFA